MPATQSIRCVLHQYRGRKYSAARAECNAASMRIGSFFETGAPRLAARVVTVREPSLASAHLVFSATKAEERKTREPKKTKKGEKRRQRRDGHGCFPFFRPFSFLPAMALWVCAKAAPSPPRFGNSSHSCTVVSYFTPSGTGTGTATVMPWSPAVVWRGIDRDEGGVGAHQAVFQGDLLDLLRAGRSWLEVACGRRGRRSSSAPRRRRGPGAGRPASSRSTGIAMSLLVPPTWPRDADRVVPVAGEPAGDDHRPADEQVGDLAAG